MTDAEASQGTLIPSEGRWINLNVDHHTIVLHEIARLDDQTSQYQLCVDRQSRGNLRLPGWLLPSIAVGANGLAVWGSCSYYLTGWEQTPLLAGAAPSEVFDVFAVDESWLLLCELDAQRVHATTGEVLAECGHHEVWFFDRWTDQGVVLTDWNQVEVVLHPLSLQRLG